MIEYRVCEFVLDDWGGGGEFLSRYEILTTNHMIISTSVQATPIGRCGRLKKLRSSACVAPT